MVLFELLISCESENVDGLSTGPDYEWHIKVKCTKC